MSEQTTSHMLGKYEIREEIGRGGFATVFRALDTTLNREVALKVLHPQLLADPAFVARFQREAQVLAGLRHPHIVTVFEVAKAEERLYIAMELAHGPSLAQAIAQRGGIPWEETLSILKPVCEALDYAHEHKVVHRDLKPPNILLDAERGPLLTDFGFARLVGTSSASLSLSGGIVGTAAYIAPEVWECDAAEAPTDIYALGCIVCEMLTGELLFQGQTPMQVMRAHDRGPQFPKEWPEGVPEGIEAVLGKTLARDPAQRYPGAGGLWYALEDVEKRAQADREAAERRAVAAQWRAEFEAAVAARVWGPARMAIGRWLAAAPDDPDALAARAKVERQLEKPRPEAPQEAGVDARASTEGAATVGPAPRRLPGWLPRHLKAVLAVALLAAAILAAASLIRRAQEQERVAATAAASAAASHTAQARATGSAAAQKTGTARVEVTVQAQQTSAALAALTATTGAGPAATSTATWTPTATRTETPEAPTATHTRTPTATLAAAPVLESPPEGYGQNSDSFTLRWSWPGKLQSNDWFDLYVWPRGEPERAMMPTKESTVKILPPGGVGLYIWRVRVVRSTPGKAESVPLSAWSEARTFDYRGPEQPQPEPSPVRPTSSARPTVAPSPTARAATESGARGCPIQADQRDLDAVLFAGHPESRCDTLTCQRSAPPIGTP